MPIHSALINAGIACDVALLAITYARSLISASRATDPTDATAPVVNQVGK